MIKFVSDLCQVCGFLCVTCLCVLYTTLYDQWSGRSVVFSVFDLWQVCGFLCVLYDYMIKFVSDLWQVCGFLCVLYATLYDQVCQ